MIKHHSLQLEWEMYRTVLAERKHLIDHTIEVKDEDGLHVVHVDAENKAVVCADIDGQGNFWHLRFPVPSLN